ncbi:MAG: hypothetical protein PHH11_13785 [Methylomonas sp.]|nr:hypothetical protein [Methylomonas sp.]
MPHTAQQVEDDVREALESGIDIYQRVKAITLKALTERQLDLENIKSVMEAAVKGIASGITRQSEPAKADFDRAMSALDDVLEKTAQASKLAIEEAASRIGEFSENDLSRAAADIQSLEQIFLETVENIARDSNKMIFDAARNFLAHAQKNGTAVGRQAHSILAALSDVRRQGQNAVLSGAATTAAIVAEIGSGILTGIAESLEGLKTKS